MFYLFTRSLAKLAMPIFFKRFRVVKFDQLPQGVPLLLASNHPDSFFDAVVIGHIMKQPIHTLTRGDVFKKKAAAFWLRQINLIPVFRGSEGREHVKKHDVTTQEVHDVLKTGDAVVVFSEGICVNEWKLRPLGKGTARMAYRIWYGDDALNNMKVIPTGLNYEHFRGFGKRVSLHFGEAISQEDIKTNPEEYEKWLREFNEILDKRMSAEILEVPFGLPAEEHQKRMDAFFGPQQKVNPILKAIGLVGRVVNWPFYVTFRNVAAKATGKSVFFDSVFFGLLLYLYPLLVTILSLIIGFVFGWAPALLFFVGMPLLGFLAAQFK